MLDSFFLNVINLLHTYTGNYGLDILLFTLILKLIFLPMSLQSIRSMKIMQKLQPKIVELQKKHKENKEKLNKELIELYKNAGANPITGCLPMLVQIPIFIIFFRILNSPSINNYMFVNSRFLGMDLTTPAFNHISTGYLAGLRYVLPLMINMKNFGILTNYYVYVPTLVLVILMAVTTFIQQRQMTVESSQSGQMMIMNVFILFISISIPSGVLLYWTFSNILQSLQQIVFFRKKDMSVKTSDENNNKLKKKQSNK